MPPFTLAALETAIGKRLGVPAYDIRTIAAQIYERYDANGPPGALWQLRPVALEADGHAGFAVCRGADAEGVYRSGDEVQARSLADALNELDQMPH